MKTEELEIKYWIYDAEKNEKVTTEFYISDKSKIAKCLEVLKECWVENALEWVSED